MFLSLSWDIWRDWIIVQSIIIFVSWLVVKYGDLVEEEDEEENGET